MTSRELSEIDKALASDLHRLAEAVKPAHDALVAGIVRLGEAAAPVYAELQRAYVQLQYEQLAHFGKLLHQAREEREARR